MNPMGAMDSAVMDGFFWSMLFLASMPYLLLLIVGGGLYRAQRREREMEVQEALDQQGDWEAQR